MFSCQETLKKEAGDFMDFVRATFLEEMGWDFNNYSDREKCFPTPASNPQNGKCHIGPRTMAQRVMETWFVFGQCREAVVRHLCIDVVSLHKVFV